MIWENRNANSPIIKITIDEFILVQIIVLILIYNNKNPTKQTPKTRETTLCIRSFSFFFSHIHRERALRTISTKVMIVYLDFRFWFLVSSF